jgi:hypothetical protein
MSESGHAGEMAPEVENVLNMLSKIAVRLLKNTESKNGNDSKDSEGRPK